MDNAIVLINTTTNRVFENLNTTNYSRKEPKQSNMDRLTPPPKKKKKKIPNSATKNNWREAQGAQSWNSGTGSSWCRRRSTTSLHKFQMLNQHAFGYLACLWYHQRRHQVIPRYNIRWTLQLSDNSYSLQNYIFQCNLKYVIHNDQRKDRSVQFCMHFKRIALCVLKEKLFKR